MTENLDSAWPEIRQRLAAVALPDSRFDMDLDSFIPAFSGVELASNLVAERDDFAGAQALFITPDNSMQVIRQLALAAGKRVLMPTYGLRRGFLKLDPADFGTDLALYASWGDGAEHFGHFVPIAEIASMGRIDLCLVGAAAVTAGGQRFGMGHRYFDVEWNVFARAGLVSDAVPIWTLVHDHQVSEFVGEARSDAVAVDAIFTPTDVIEVPKGARPVTLRPETLIQLFGATIPEAVARAVRLAGDPQ